MIETRRIYPNEPFFEDVLELRWYELDKDDGIKLPTNASVNDITPSTIHVAAFDGSRVVGTVRVDSDKEHERTGLIRRMAVAPDMRHRGIGTLALALAEHLSVQRREVIALRLNARQTAVGFYKANGYETTGNYYTWPPTDDGNAHLEMIKYLENDEQ